MSSSIEKTESSDLYDLPELNKTLLKLALLEKEEGLSPVRVQMEMLKMISKIDRILEDQLNIILHHPDFQALESSWRSLHFLIGSFSKSRKLKFKALNVTKRELLRDFEKSIDFEISHLFDLLYKREYGSFGGKPFSLLIGNYSYSHRPKDMHLLDCISQVVSSCHAVYIDSIHPHLLDMESFSELGNPGNLSWIMARKELLKWRAFREKENSRYVCMALPRMLLREPHKPGDGRINQGGFRFKEQTQGVEGESHLWGNASYAVAQRICESYLTYGWTVRFFGSKAGQIRSLPQVTYKEGGKKKIASDVVITDRVEKELSDFGFLPIAYSETGDTAVLLSAQTVHRPKVYRKVQGTENERLSAMLPHVLTASRFAHYLKTMLREKIGKFTNRKDLQSFLNNWLGGYVIADTSVDTELRHLLPLKNSRVTIVESTNKPGKFFFVAHISPHYQLEGLDANVVMASEISGNEMQNLK